ncbi:MAG TPA: hypothetical protein VFV79_07310 [Saprospiraceae bacterium]|nr:hypothetical protein [Saprospiraceae bacterium]
MPKIGYFIMAALLCWGCVDSPNFPDVPRIEFLGMSKDTIKQGIFQQDSLVVVFKFEDGDGDIGRADQEHINDVFFIDERTGTLDNTFGIPLIPQEGAGNGVEGEVRILLFSTCCIYPDGSDPCTINPNYPIDSLQYRIYIKDRAGHTSNEILTPYIKLLCQ